MDVFSEEHVHELCRSGLDRFVSASASASLPLDYKASLKELCAIVSGNLHSGRLERQNRYRSSQQALTLAAYIDRVIATWVQERPRWQSLQANEPDAWLALKQDLMRAAKRLILRRPVAGSFADTPEDYVQLACLQIKRAEYRFDIPLIFWARSILKNTIRQPDRSRDALDLWHFSLDEPFASAEGDSGIVSEYADRKADSVFDRVHEREALLSAVGKLTLLRQAILILTFFDECTDAEIVKKLDISLTHLYSTRHRALKQLLELLEKR